MSNDACDHTARIDRHRKIIGLRRKIPSRLLAAAHTVRRFTGLPQTHRCGDFAITLPADHWLPLYQKQHRLYDRFLPMLCQSFSPREWIIDVGANCGDTVAAILSRNRSVSCVCIEGDEAFFRLLTSNLTSLAKDCPAAQVIPIAALVGTGAVQGTLEGARGTSTLKADGASTGKTKWLSLEQIVGELPQTAPLRERSANSEIIRLIKSDVDGFDHDVLASAGTLLDEPGLLLYFECQCADTDQLRGYLRTFELLMERGFCTFSLFDNFGNYMAEVSTLRQLETMLDYVWTQTRGLSTQTIYYYDILASKPASTSIAEAALGAWKNFVESGA
jgi:FkbM family methyltransferase